MKKTSKVRKAIFLFLLFHLSYITSYSQWYDPEKVNQKAADIYTNAYNAAQDGKYNKAIDNVNEAIRIDPN